MKKAKLLAHAGGMITGVENTLETFQKARDLGADAFEIDVQLTKDNEPVVFHDEETVRLTGFLGRVDGLTLKELQELRVHGKYKIPHLRDVFNFLGAWPEADLYLDFHNSSLKLAEVLGAIIGEYKLENRVYPLAFYYDKEFLLHAREVNPKIQLALMPRLPWTIASRSKELKSPKICVGWDRDWYNKILFKVLSLMTNVPGTIRTLQKEGFEISGGVSNTKEEILWFLERGVDGIWTDDVKLCRSVIDGFAK